jgi:hypothetical protein
VASLFDRASVHFNIADVAFHGGSVQFVIANVDFDGRVVLLDFGDVGFDIAKSHLYISDVLQNNHELVLG